ncbi:uncharacterized protein V1518DRAFT_144170 [Limtongia smithiae]|uniref:uncharacterized protein n=1 Tax=Limtongia smithiae TaxID=1125753 RepID=UPI0034CD2D84
MSTSSSSLNDILRVLTFNCKLPLTGALPIATALVNNGLKTKEAIGGKTTEEIKEICPSLTPQQLGKLHAACGKPAKTTSPRKKRSAATTSDDTADAPDPVSTTTSSSKKARKSHTRFKDNSSMPVDDAALELPCTLDEEEIISTPPITLNRAPVMILFAYAVIKHLYPEYGAGSHLSLASATAAAASRNKARSIGVTGVGENKINDHPAGYRTLQTLGTVEVSVIRRGDREEGYWGLDVDAMERQANREAAGGALASLQTKWIHPAQVHDYLVRAFGEKGLASANGALAIVITSWQRKYPGTWQDRSWGWYVGTRPEISGGKEGWGQRGSIACKDILRYRTRGDSSG